MGKKIVAISIAAVIASIGTVGAQSGGQTPELFGLSTGKAASSGMPTGVSNMLRNKSAFWATPITVDKAMLTKATPQMVLNMPEVGNIRVNLAKSYRTGTDTVVWSGASQVSSKGGLLVNGEIPATALFVVRGQRVTGQITTSAGEIFELVTSEDGGQQFMVKRDPRSLAEADDTPTRVDIPAQRADAREAPSTRAGETIIRILQVYTPEAASELGGQAAARDRAAFFIAQSNTAFANNAIPVLFESADVRFSTVPQPTNSSSTLVSNLTNTSDGYMDGFATTTRNNTRADLVALVVRNGLSSPGGALCGQAAAIGANAASGFFVQNQSCTTFTFVHEAAHLFGARHDNDGTTTPFAYGHGFVNAAGNLRTIMAVNGNPQPRLGFFSTDDQTVFRNGANRSLGNAAVADNERVMAGRAATIAGFR
jgi:peptidyl-Asp metalloendopeptidase